MLIKSENLKKIRLSDKQGCHNILGTSVDMDKLAKQLEKEELTLPDDAVQYGMRMIIERDFLNYTNFQSIIKQKKPFPEQGWIRIARLPVSSVEGKIAWQKAISTLHALGLRLCYVLLRADSETKLFLGAIPMKKGTNAKEAEERLNLAVSSQMVGIDTQSIDQNTVSFELMNFQSCGAVTGIPSTRKSTGYGGNQTMDQIAAGLCRFGEEKNFAIIISAEPVVDAQIVDVLRIMENMGSEIHALTQYSRTEGVGSDTTVSTTCTDEMNRSISVEGRAGAGIEGLIDFELNCRGSVAHDTTITNSETASVGTSDSISMQYISKSAMYCEELFDKHIARMKVGRSLGFWKTGIYVLAEDNSTVQTVMGLLRAAYSGDDTYIEPIRMTLMPHDSGAAACVKAFRHIPYSHKEVASILGDLYQDYATPMTTEELSIVAKLPHWDS